MVNESKKNERRYWNKWKKSGAVGNIHSNSGVRVNYAVMAGTLLNYVRDSEHIVSQESRPVDEHGLMVPSWFFVVDSEELLRRTLFTYHKSTMGPNQDPASLEVMTRVTGDMSFNDAYMKMSRVVDGILSGKITIGGAEEPHNGFYRFSLGNLGQVA